MRTSLLATLVALALALMPAPRASAQEIGEAAAGLTALAMLGAVLAQHRAGSRDDGRRLVTRGYAPPPRADRHETRRHDAARERPLPGRCELPGQRGDGLYGEHCLRQAGLRTERLPRECRVRLGHGHRSAIDARCLREASRR